MSAKDHAKKLRDEAFDEGVDEDMLSDFICKRTNEQLKELQEEFDGLKWKIRGENKPQRSGNKPKALIKFLEIKLKEKTTEVERKATVNFFKRVLEDPYLRDKPSDRETSKTKNYPEVTTPEGLVEMLFSEGQGPVMNFFQVKEIAQDNIVIEIINTKIRSALQNIFKAYIEFAKA